MTYRFTLNIEPRGQKRDRIGVIGGHARSYKDGEQARYEAKIRALLAQDAPPVPIEGPVELSIICYLPVPVSWSKKKRNLASFGLVRPLSKPDVDNAAKGIMDCMNGLIWRDDKQVVTLTAAKHYNDNPHWEITVKEI